MEAQGTDTTRHGASIASARAGRTGAFEEELEAEPSLVVARLQSVARAVAALERALAQARGASANEAA